MTKSKWENTVEINQDNMELVAGYLCLKREPSDLEKELAEAIGVSILSLRARALRLAFELSIEKAIPGTQPFQKIQLIALNSTRKNTKHTWDLNTDQGPPIRDLLEVRSHLTKV